jgi:hypothetical protein
MYYGITYPKILARKTIQWLWKRYMCPKGKHLLDEVWSQDDWYLSCDACNLMINIRRVDDTHVEKKRI